MKRFLPVLAGVLVLAALGAGAWWRLRSGDATNADSTAAGASPATSAASTFSTDIAIPVEGVEAVEGTLILSVTAGAQAAPVRQTEILAQVNGRVERLRVGENAVVRAGQILAQIDSTEAALNVARARAALAQAQASYREFTLFDDQIADSAVRAERDRTARAKSGLATAEVNVRGALLELARTTIRAPFPGRVASIQIVEGQHVRVGDPLLTVVDLDPILVEAEVLESEIGWLGRGGGAAVTFAAYPGDVFTGTIATINPQVDSVTRTARVTVRLPNREARILPGMYARVALEAQRFEQRLMVPRAAILERDNRAMLFVYKDGRSDWRYVHPGLQNDSVVELVPDTEMDEVLPGEIVLVDGHYTLTHDAPIRLVESVRGEEGGRPR